MKAGKLLIVLAAMGLLAAGSYSLGARAADLADSGSTTWHSDRPLARLIRGQLGRFMVLRSDLDLTADQKQQIATILQTHKSEIIAAVQPVVARHRSLRQAIASADDKAIRAAADDLGHAIGDAAVVASRIKQEIAPILTDKQRERIGDYRAQSDKAVDDFFTKIAGGQ